MSGSFGLIAGPLRDRIAELRNPPGTTKAMRSSIGSGLHLANGERRFGSVRLRNGVETVTARRPSQICFDCAKGAGPPGCGHRPFDGGGDASGADTPARSAKGVEL